MKLVVNKFNQPHDTPLILDIHMDASAVFWTHIRFNDKDFEIDKNFTSNQTSYGIDLTFYAKSMHGGTVSSTLEMHGETYLENEVLKHHKIFSSTHLGLCGGILELVFLKINPSDEAKIIALVYDGPEDN